MTYATTAFPKRGLMAIVLTGTVIFAASCSEKSATLGPQVSVLAVPDTVIVTPESDTINALGDSIQLTAVVYDESMNVLPDTVIWKSNNETRATVSGGWVTATGRGNVIIYARAGSARTLARVLVQQVVDSIAITPQTPTVEVGDTFRLNLYAADSSGALVEGGSVLWVSSDPSVATVDNTGLVTAITAGAVNVTARLSGPGIISPVRAKTRVNTVYPSGAFMLTPAVDTIRAIGYTKQYSTNSLIVNGDTVAVTYRSLNPNFASIDPVTGLATARKRGVARIVARAGIFSDTAELNVIPLVASVTITPDTVNLAIGETAPLTGIAYDSGGTQINACPPSTTCPAAKLGWVSTDTTIATVDATGVVTGVATGTANIIGTRGSVSDTVFVEVLSPDSTVHIWTTGVAGDWTDGSKWTPSMVPAETDTAQIPLSGSAVTLTAATTIAQIVMGAGTTLDVGAFDFTVDTDVLVDGVITSGGGTLRLTGIGGMSGTLPRTLMTGPRSVSGSTKIVDSLTIQDGSLVIADQAVTIEQP